MPLEEALSGLNDHSDNDPMVLALAPQMNPDNGSTQLGLSMRFVLLSVRLLAVIAWPLLLIVFSINAFQGDGAAAGKSILPLAILCWVLDKALERYLREPKDV